MEKDVNHLFLIMFILSFSSFSRHRTPHGITLIFLPCGLDVTGSWLFKNLDVLTYLKLLGGGGEEKKEKKRKRKYSLLE